MNQKNVDLFSMPPSSQLKEEMDTKDNPKKQNPSQKGITYDWISCSCGHHHQVTILPNGRRIVDTGNY